jgi:hypothetical protein
MDGGENWEIFNAGLPSTFASALVFHPTNPALLYLGVWGGGVFAIQQGD